jgi:Pentapeptide repeats (8 copies)
MGAQEYMPKAPPISETRKWQLLLWLIESDPGNGAPPFNDRILSPADVEWLLAHGPKDAPGDLPYLDLRGALIGEIDLTQANLSGTRMEGVYLEGARLKGADLEGVQMEGAILTLAQLENAACWGANMRDASLSGAQCRGADLSADLRGADLQSARLENVDMRWAELQGAFLKGAYLAATETCPGADMRGAVFDAGTRLEEVVIGGPYGSAVVADLNWGGANLSVIDWALVKELGDDQKACRAAEAERGKGKNRHDWSDAAEDAWYADWHDPRPRALEAYRDAVRANLQLATALRDQGVNDVAARFAYKGFNLQRKVLWSEGRWPSLAGALLLWLTSGYGYRPWRSVATYVTAILAFASMFHFLGHGTVPPLTWHRALVFSIASFHGRGLFPSGVTIGDAITVAAAAEALLGLVVEIVFIASFTRRVFGL